MVQEILKLGNPLLFEKSEEVLEDDLIYLPKWLNDLHDTLMNYKKVHGAGRAIAAPQIGIKKRLLYMHTDKPYVFINPVLTFPNSETFIVLDDCMSFPGLLAKVERYKEVDITYLDENFIPKKMHLEEDYSELLQHEYDHLDGILATMRAVDQKSFFMK